jgi:predicted MFS family arabinose efflux permease
MRKQKIHEGRNMRQESTYNHQPMKRILIILALFAAIFGMQMPSAVLSLFLIDIAAHFNVPVGIGGQIGTAAFIVTVVTAAFSGILTSRYPHKTLLLVSVGALSLGALGSTMAPNFQVVLATYALTGISVGLTGALTMSLIGRYFSVAERPKTTSYIVIAFMMPSLVAAPLLGALGDWRLGFGSVFALACIVAITIFAGLPHDDAVSGRTLEGYTAVLKNKSALGTIFGNILASTGFMTIYVFGASLYREQFGMSPEFVSMLASTGMSITWIVGSLIAGRMIPLFGRKTMTVIFSFVNGLSVIAFTTLPSVWLSLLAFYIGSFSAGIRGTSVTTLSIEQVPEHREVMQAMTMVSQFLASTLTTSIGGLILVWFNYNWLAMLGLSTVIGGAIFQILTIDPTKAG